MKSFLIIFLFSMICNAQEYEFLNQVITPFEKNNPIPRDTIFIVGQYRNLKSDFENINEETIKLWWTINLSKNIPPVELFLKQFHIDTIQSEINKLNSNLNIEKDKLNDYFYLCNTEYINKNPKNYYIKISRPLFNKNKDWCFIVRNSFIPTLNVYGGDQLEVYTKIDNKWILYNSVTISFN